MQFILTQAGGRNNLGGDRSFSSGGGGFGSGGYTGKDPGRSVRMSSNRIDRGYSVREQLPLPTKPPYTVHLGNMSFDATEGDIQDYFAGCSVTSVRIVEDKIERKPKGFGYAEFATLEGLKKALEFNGTQFQGRNIRVSVAEPRKSDHISKSSSDLEVNPITEKDRPDTRDFGDWSRKGPLPDIAGQRRGSDRSTFGGDRGTERGGYNRSFDNASEAGSERGNRRPAYEQNESKIRDFGNWERKGPLTPTVPNANTSRPVSHDGPRERKNSPAWGEGRSQEGSRPPRREFVERPVIDRAPTAPELDHQWRTKMRPDPPAASPTPSVKDTSVPSSPAAPATLSAPAAHAPPTSRPILNLSKRTVSSAETSPAPSSATDSKPSPFGAARPIDTFSKEKEIEEKRESALKEKKAAEEKAREEKRVADEKVRDEKKVAKESEKSVPPKEKTNGQVKEKENGVEAPGKNYQILRRAANEDMAVADEGIENEVENGVIAEDKAIKPQEIIRDIPSTKTNGVETQQPEASAEKLEDDGWSTVSKPRNNRKGGYQAARAIAS